MALRAQLRFAHPSGRRVPIFRWGCAGALCLVLVSGLGKVAAAADAIVHPARTHQRITGFGASSAWTTPTLSDADADLLFSTDNGGIGLSLLRVRIAPDGSCAEVTTAQQAQARGAQVWATPWSPPAAWKSNDDVNEGGTLRPEHAADWAQSLVGFVSMMKTNGVDIVALSAQNEPTMKVDYESCIYTPAELGTFITKQLRPALDSAGFALPVVAPETVGWNELPVFSSVILGDPGATAAIGIFATHGYDGTPFDSTDVAAAGKELWQTEIYDQSATADAGIASGLSVALNINASLSRGSVNAWHYWWIRPRGDTRADNSALWDQATNLPAKRLYALGNFSRFVRPGFLRVEVPLSPSVGLAMSAFTDPNSGALVIVAINQNSEPVAQTFAFDGATTGSWQSWVTSADLDLAPGPAVPDGTRVSFSLAPRSITTLQGSITGPGPVIDDGSTTQAATSDTGGCACSTRASGHSAAWAWPSLLALLGLSAQRRTRKRVD